MSRLRLATYRQLARLAEQCGFGWARCVGSHNTFRHNDGRIVVIPDHGAQPIVRPLLRRLVRDLGLSVEQYNDLIERL